MARGIFEVVGLGERRKGYNQEKKREYDFQEASLLYDNKNVTGRAACVCLIGGEDLDAVGGLRVGDMLDVAYHWFKGSIRFDSVIGKG